MTSHNLNIQTAHPSWHAVLLHALNKINPDYLLHLTKNDEWLPGPEKIFNAFTLPFDQVKFILFGESPYPRKQSANGFAFWDAAVNEVWSADGLSKKVNRATSLRNIFKMLLVAEKLLSPENMSQIEITKIDKKNLIQTNHEFFTNLLNHGFLLLNASLVLQKTAVKKDAAAWYPFIKEILHVLIQKNPDLQLILFGQIAKQITPLIENHPKIFISEHPYNLSFITNPQVIEFFKPLHLLTI